MLKSGSDTIEFDGVDLADMIVDRDHDPDYEDCTIKIGYYYSAACRGERERGSGLQISPDEPEGVEIENVSYFDPVSSEWVEVELDQVQDDFLGGYEVKIIEHVHDEDYDPNDEYNPDDRFDDNYDDVDYFDSDDY